MDNFHHEFYTNQLEYEEGLLRDRKVILPNLHKPESKAEFIRDLISFANSAKLIGRTAFILYGIDNEGFVTGIGDSLSPYAKNGSDLLAWEQLKREIGDILENYIVPELPNWDLKHDSTVKSRTLTS